MYRGFFKRLFDIVFSLIGILLSLIIFLIVAPIIKLTDNGPIFYTAPRLGKKGKIFKMYKFRSMYVNAPDIRNADGSTYNGKSDPRVTKIGKFMRSTSIDELPQLLNVLKGDMSLIGPRAHLTTNYKGYDLLSQEQKKRLEVRPGITGYNQAYFRNSVTAEEKIKNDNYYVEHLSFWMDIKVLFKTVATVLKRKNVFVEQKIGIGKRLLIIGASILQVPAIKKAKELGFYVGVIDYNPNAVGIPLADEFFNVSTIDIDGVVSVAEKFKPSGIMTLATDMPMRSVATACKKLGLPGISMETAIKSTDKGEMIKAFVENGVEHPWFFIIDNEEELKAVFNKINYPCIMKPTDSSGSRGVQLINNQTELLDAYNYSKEYSKKGRVIVEEYMVGSEVSVEIIVTDETVHILQVTDKLTTGAPHFVEMGHSQPSKLSIEDLNKIKDLATRAVKAVGITNGPAHVEIMLTKEGPKMVELGARMGGDCITTHLVPLSTGIDMVKEVIMLACGLKTDLTPKAQMGSAIRFFNTKSGVIQDINGAEEAEKIQGVKEISFTKSVGDKVGEIKGSTDRVGFVIAQAHTAEEAINICEKATNAINIVVN